MQEDLNKLPIPPRADKGKVRMKYDQSLSKKHRSYLSRANAKRLEFTLTAEEFERLCNGTCVYCSEPATGIDRKDSRRGYTTSNSQSCCGTCNMMKRTMSEHQFIEHCQKIVAIYQQKYW